MSTFTPNKNLEKPDHGAYNDTWDVPVNADWTAIDNAFGGYAVISVTGIVAGTYPLSLARYQPPNIIFSGTLTANLNYQFPAGVGGIWSVYSETSGAFTITLSSASAGGTVVIPAGSLRTLVVCDTRAGVALADSADIAVAGPAIGLINTTRSDGTAKTFMRSDAAPAINLAMNPTWSGAHVFNGAVTHNNTVTMGAGKSFSGSAGNVDVPTVSVLATKDTSAASTSAVFTYAAPLVSPALTGVPTAPTAAVNTNTTQIATCAFVQSVANGTFHIASATAGYEVSPTGKITIWGVGGISTGSFSQTVTFAQSGLSSFPTACVNVIVCGESGTTITLTAGGFSKTGFTLGSNSGNGGFCYFYATGY